jgi:hypothetical protein
MAGRKKEVIAESVKQAGVRTLDEVGSAEPIEPVAEGDLISAAKTEEFMNQKLTVIVMPDQAEGALPVITVNVNGVNQNFIRNKAQQVKRKYVEVLARSRITAVDQREATNPMELAVLDLTQVSSLAYPFTVISDPSPEGPEWLMDLLNQE